MEILFESVNLFIQIPIRVAQFMIDLIIVFSYFTLIMIAVLSGWEKAADLMADGY